VNRVEYALRVLSGPPVDLGTAGTKLPRGGGVYAWWAAPTVFPDLFGPEHPDDPALRLLYVGRATSLRGRITRNHLRKSGNSTLRRTLAGLLMPTEGYHTMWTDRVVLIPEDERRLTGWMHAHLRLTWAEDPAPREIEDALIQRLTPPLNVSGVNTTDLLPAVIAAKNLYNTSAAPSPPA
jgi:hypothetical protein